MNMLNIQQLGTQKTAVSNAYHYDYHYNFL